MGYVAIADRDHEVEHHDPQTFITKYIWSQDHKVIAIQYGLTAIFVGLIALGLSAMMRLQLGFPDSFSFINPENYYQFITMHGMIMVIYLLTALFLGGFGNYLIPLMCGSRDMVFPYMNMLSYWVYLLSVIILLISFFVPGGSTGAGWTLYPPQAIKSMLKGCDFAIICVPKIAATENLISTSELASMKTSAYLIDVSRGGIVDQKALLIALKENIIAGAALDVFPEEPLPSTNPLWKLPNVIITPHISGVSRHYDERALDLFSENLRRYLTDTPLYNVIDPQKGY